MPVRKGYKIKEISYYFAQEDIVFKNKDAARRYYNKNIIFEDYDDMYEWRDFLANKFYYDEVFDLTDEEKKEIREEYKEYVFERWAEEELTRCEIYDDEEENDEE